MIEPGTPCEAPRLVGHRPPPIMMSQICWVDDQDAEWWTSIATIRTWLRPAPRPWVWRLIWRRLMVQRPRWSEIRSGLVRGICGTTEMPTASDWQREHQGRTIIFPDGQSWPGMAWSHGRRSRR